MFTSVYWGGYWSGSYWTGSGEGASTPSTSVPAGVTVFSISVPVNAEDES